MNVSIKKYLVEGLIGGQVCLLITVSGQQAGNESRPSNVENLSQQFLVNGFCNIIFGFHNKQGIHGACPGEILHLVLLGWFKYLIDVFFQSNQKIALQ